MVTRYTRGETAGEALSGDRHDRQHPTRVQLPEPCARYAEGYA